MSAEKKNNPLVYLFKKTWEYSRGNRPRVVLYLFMFIISECLNTFWSPIVFANMMNVVSTEGVTSQSINKLLVLLLLIPVGPAISWAFHGPARIIEETNAFSAKANYKKFLLQGVMNMPLEWHNDHHSGDTIDKIEKGTSSMYEFSSETFRYIKPIIKLIGCFSAVVYFSNLSAVIVFGIMLVGVFITLKIDGICGPQIRELSKKENRISEGVFDSISNISTVIILRVEKLVFDSIVKKIVEPYDLFKRNCTLNELKWFLTNLCCTVMISLVLGLYFYEHMNSGEAVAVGSLWLIISFLDKISDLFYDFTALYGWTTRRMYRLMNAEELTADFKASSFTNHVLPSGWKNLDIRNLVFSYDAETGPHLNNVSISIRRGMKIAFVGETGSGKTTMLKVMRDLHLPTSCKVVVDGETIEEGFAGISRAISLIPQSPEIFATTIHQNITIGAEYDMDLVRRYTDMAKFTEVAEKLPNGFDSSIKEKGVNLSGGQTQRLALSRGLLASHDKDIILLDEPTSSLDFMTEMLVYRGIFSGFEGKTIISSIHRLHLLPLFDCIYMFENGRIVGSGTVSELLGSCPQFAELWQKQLDIVE